jgi:hypothetical protein
VFFACYQDNIARYYTAQYVSTILYYRSPAETPEVDPAAAGPCRFITPSAASSTRGRALPAAPTR